MPVWVNCIFYSKYGKCSHIERGKGFLWLGKRCILLDTFPKECRFRIEYERPITPPPPPPKRQVGP